MDEAKENIKSVAMSATNKIKDFVHPPPEDSKTDFLTVGVGLIVAGLLTWGIYKACKHFGSHQATVVPAPTRPALTCADYVRKELPQGEIKSVTGDGACLPRAVSLIIWGTEEHWKIIARALNKKMIELFESMMEFLIFPLKRKVGGREGELQFKDKEEFLKFLLCDESLAMWREGPDLAMVAHLLRSRVDVLISKDKKLDGGCPMVYGEQYEDSGSIVLILNTEEKHYLAVVDTQNPHKNLKLLEYLNAYVDENKKGMNHGKSQGFPR